MKEKIFVTIHPTFLEVIVGVGLAVSLWHSTIMI